MVRYSYHYVSTFATTPLGLHALDACAPHDAQASDTSHAVRSLHSLSPLEECILRFCLTKKLTISELVEKVRTTLPGYHTGNAIHYIADATIRLLDHGLLKEDSTSGGHTT